MSMSTKIDELPGSNININNYESEQEKLYIEKPIEANIVKTVQDVNVEKKSVLSNITKEVNEDNLLVLLIIFLTALPQLTYRLSFLPIIGRFLSYPDSMSTVIIKSLLLFLLFLILKKVVLPKIKL